MIESIQGITYGKIVTEESYRDSQVTNRVRMVQQSIATKDRAEMFKQYLEQFNRFIDGEADTATIELHKDKKTGEPCRVVIVSKEVL